MREMQVLSLGLKDTLEKEMATHSSILAGESHAQRSLVGYGPWSCKESDTIVVTEHSIHTHASVIRFCIICCMQST